jgi:hypothetical protein
VAFAELEVFHSRPVAPTRRVALGHVHLPTDPAPGFGGLLLGGVVAAHMPGLDPELFDDLDRLAIQLQQGHRIPQPRLRHRFQTDRIGLQRSVHKLAGEGEDLVFDLADSGSPAHHVLAAVYAAGRLPVGPRSRVMATVRKAMRWSGGLDSSLVAYLSGVGHNHAWSAAAQRDPIGWALKVLDLSPGRNGARPTHETIQGRFREMLRQAHPDHGGEAGIAAERIAALSQARRILLTAS